MATVGDISIDTTTDEVVLQNFTVKDPEIASYLSEFDAEDQNDAVERAFRIGASALQLVETSTEAEIVEQRFNEMEREFESELDELRDELDDRFSQDDGELSRILDQHLGDGGTLQDHLEDAFGSDGKFEERLKDQLGEDGEKIREALDPNTDGTPTNELKERLVEEIEKIKKQLNQQEAEQAVREKTRLKGYDFEEQIEEMLDKMVRQTSNQFEDTSEQTGALGKSKKGDFVVTLADTNQRIAVEAKNGDFQGTVEDQMEEAIENREADYGILVASSVKYLPRTRVGWFSEIDQDYVVVALSDDEDKIEPRFFKFAYHWARTRTILSAVDVDDDIDPEVVKSELDGIEDSIDQFQQIRSNCKDLENSVDRIKETLEDIEKEVSNRISRLESEISQTG